MWRWRQLAQLCRYLIGGSKIKPLTAFSCDHRFKCAWTVPSCGRTRLIVCFDFVKLLSELEIRPECLPSTLPRTLCIFSQQAPEITSTSSPGLIASLSRLLLSLTCADWEITPCHKAAPQRPRPHSDIHCFCCDRVLFSLPTYFSSSHFKYCQLMSNVLVFSIISLYFVLPLLCASIIDRIL